jgi:hypothetical protein
MVNFPLDVFAKLRCTQPKPHPDALSVFNFERLFQEGIATYGSYELDIYNEAIQLLIDTRQYLKDATSELASL